MRRIFWGLIFVFFNLNINLGNSTISFLPAFVGYALIVSGMKQVPCGAYMIGRTWACVGTVYNAVFWVLNCLGIINYLSSMGLFAVSFTLAGTILQLGTLHWITKGICELEETEERTLSGDRLKNTWVALLVCAIAALVTSLLGLAVIAAVGHIASFIAMICYLVRFHASRKEYEGRPEKTEEDNYEPSDHF